MFQRLLQFLGFGLCHQLPERSFFGGGVQVPVCARDTGIYVGLAVAVLLLLAFGRGRRPSNAPPWIVAVLSVLFVVSMGWDGLTSYAGFRTTTNELRLLTGLLTGFGMAPYVVTLLAETLLRSPGQERVLGRGRDILLWIAAVPVTFAVVRWVLPLSGAVYPVIVAACILFAFTAVNLVIVGVFQPFERSVVRARDLLAPSGIALLLAGVEILGGALLRVVLV